MRKAFLFAALAVCIVLVAVICAKSEAAWVTKIHMDDGGDTMVVDPGGLLKFYGGGRQDCVVNVAEPTTFVLQAQPSAAWYKIKAPDLSVTLPASESGAIYNFVITADGLSTGDGFTITPDAADSINGNGLTSVDGAALICAGSGDREGDFVSLLGDGDDGWYVVGSSGTWTKAE